MGSDTNERRGGHQAGIPELAHVSGVDHLYVQMAIARTAQVLITFPPNVGEMRVVQIPMGSDGQGRGGVATIPGL